MPIMDSEFALVDEITKADPEWRAAMARRGYEDLSQIRTCPITAGRPLSPSHTTMQQSVVPRFLISVSKSPRAGRNSLQSPTVITMAAGEKSGGLSQAS